MSTAAWALDLSSRLASVGILIGACEQWATRSNFRPGGILSTPLHLTSQWRQLLTRRQTLTVFVVVQITMALVVVTAGVSTVWGWSALCVLTIAFVGLRWYRRSGGDGADQMASIVLIATVLAAPAFPGDLRLAVGAGFIAAQAVLAYTTSGIAKLISPVWRDGTGLAGILSAVEHGTPRLGLWLTRHPLLSTWASWGTIVFECSFVLVLVVPPPAAGALLVLALCFHAACAVFMGLNSFLWAFPATYPCVWFAAEAIHGVVG